MRKSTSDYPPEWPEIAKRVKEEAGWKCVRCGHAHDPASGHTLTVHHLDMSPKNVAWYNLPALCQRCHLTIQAKVIMSRPWLFEHTPWMKPYAAGFYAHINGLPEDREYVMAHLEELLELAVRVGE